MSKSEARSTKSEANPKFETMKIPNASRLRFPSRFPRFEFSLFVSDFGLRISNFATRALWSAALTAAWTTTVLAASPQVITVLPKGARRGADAEVVLRGSRLASPQELLFYRPGLRMKQISPQGDKGEAVKAVIEIPADCPLGEHPFRLRTASGLTDVQTFMVGTLPGVDEAEPNDEFDKPQRVSLNTTVSGIVRNEDIDYFAFDAKKGQRITAEVEGMRLGQALFDPYVAILDARRFELAASDDSALLLQDPVASIIAPEDGTYTVLVREAAYGGGDRSAYRLHVGTFPRPLAAFPPGGKPGETLDLRFLGDAGGAFTGTFAPAAAGEWPVFAEQQGEWSPSPIYLRVSPLPCAKEQEPNDTREQATAIPDKPPLACHGVIEKDGDADWFRFTAQKGQALNVSAFARRLRSPLDSVVAVHGPDGNRVAENDDSGGPDSSLSFTAQADGECTVQIRDQLDKGGPAYAYRIEVTPPEPSLGLSVPVFKKDTQERQAIVVPRGNRFATLVGIKRDNVDGDILLALDGLPEGLRADAPTAPGSLGQAPVLFEASADAPPAGCLVSMKGRCADPAKKVEGSLVHAVELIRGEPNNTVYYRTTVDRLAVAIAEEAPFRIDLALPKSPLVQSGAMNLKVSATRREGFDAPIRLSMLYNPPGIGSPPDVTIPEKSAEAVIPINAAGDAEVRTWKVAVIGVAQVGGGDLWVSTGFIDLEVAPPYVVGQLGMVAVEQGKTVDVACALDQRRPFDGKARIRLLGLPPKTAAEERFITSADKQVVFPVAAAPDSPVGQHKALFCSADFERGGETVAQTVAGGGALRIDPPPKNEPPPKQEDKKKEEPAKPEKPPSRLEELRQRQMAAGSGE
jgi:hypothetical protein